MKELSEADLLEVATAYRPRLRAAAQRILKDPEEAEDAVQDGILSALTARQGFRGDALPSSWLYRITVNCALMRLRSRRRRPAQQLGDVEPATEAVLDALDLAPDRRCAARHRLEEAARRIERLPAAQRRALELRAMDGCSIGEIADSLGRSRNGVKMLIHRARETLRSHEDEARVARPAGPGRSRSHEAA